MSQPKLFLHDHPISSYAQKIRMALRHKQLPFDHAVPENLGSGQPNPSFTSANPRMEVPALVVNDTFKIFDSTAIIMYLEEKFPQSPSLLPDSPEARAEARMIEEVCDTHFEAINWALGEVKWFKRAEKTGLPDLEAKLVAAAREQTSQIYDWLETQLGGSNPFFNGSSIGYADFCVAPILNRAALAGNSPISSSSSSATGQPNLAAWYERVKQNSAVAETFAEVEKAAPLMAKLGPEAWEKGQGRRREYRDHRLEFMVKNGGLPIVVKGIEDGNIRFSWPQPR